MTFPKPSKQLREDGTLKESAVQSQIKKILALEGYFVVHTSAPLQKRRSGVTKGVPDLLVMRPGTSVWIGLEVKAKDAKGNWKYSCWEQWDLHSKCYTFVVTNEEQALWAMAHIYPDKKWITNIPRIMAELVKGEPKK